jgi:hypothetical protein
MTLIMRQQVRTDSAARLCLASFELDRGFVARSFEEILTRCITSTLGFGQAFLTQHSTFVNEKGSDFADTQRSFAISFFHNQREQAGASEIPLRTRDRLELPCFHSTLRLFLGYPGLPRFSVCGVFPGEGDRGDISIRNALSIWTVSGK